MFSSSNSLKHSISALICSAISSSDNPKPEYFFFNVSSTFSSSGRELPQAVACGVTVTDSEVGLLKETETS